MKKFLTGIFIVIVGCSFEKEDIPQHIKGTENLIVYSVDAEPTASIEMVQEATFKAPDKFSLEWYDDTVSIYSWLAAVEIDDSGRVFIFDNSAKKIHVFDSDGSYLTSKGREGRGPGEYYGITDTEIVSNQLYVFDFLGFRTTVYSLDSLQVIESSSVRPPVNQDEVDEISGLIRSVPLLRSDGTYLAAFRENLPDHRVGSPTYNLKQDRPIKYYFMNKESKIVSDKIFEIKKSHADLVAKVGDQHLSNIRAFHFIGRTMITISNDNHIFTTWTDDFLIKVYGPDGNYQRAIYYPIQKKPLRREEITALFDKDDRNRDLAEHAELPKTWPAIRSMIADDKNRLWVSTVVAQDGVREWRVLKDTGELAAKFGWPDNRSIKVVKDGHAYVLLTDEKTGQQKIVKYRIKMN